MKVSHLKRSQSFFEQGREANGFFDVCQLFMSMLTLKGEEPIVSDITFAESDPVIKLVRKSTNYRSGTVNSKSFVGKVLLRIKRKFELTYAL